MPSLNVVVLAILQQILTVVAQLVRGSNILI
jgi:hypothetical protein